MLRQRIIFHGAGALLIAVALIFCGSCTTMDIEAEKQALIDTDLAFSAMSVEKGMQVAFDAYMTDDAVMYREGSHPIVGRVAIGERMPPREAGTLSWKPFKADLAESGDLGYTLGDWEFVATDSTGAEQVSRGHYVSIWRKQPDGSWKWVFDSGVTGPKPDTASTGE